MFFVFSRNFKVFKGIFFMFFRVNSSLSEAEALPEQLADEEGRASE